MQRTVRAGRKESMWRGRGEKGEGSGEGDRGGGKVRSVEWCRGGCVSDGAQRPRLGCWLGWLAGLAGWRLAGWVVVDCGMVGTE